MNSCSQRWERDRRGTRPEGRLEATGEEGAGDTLDPVSDSEVIFFTRESPVEPDRETKCRYLLDEPVMPGSDLSKSGVAISRQDVTTDFRKETVHLALQ